MNVRWSIADQYLVSMDGKDKAIFQWKHKMTTPDHSDSSETTTSKDDDNEPS